MGFSQEMIYHVRTEMRQSLVGGYVSSVMFQSFRTDRSGQIVYLDQTDPDEQSVEVYTVCLNVCMIWMVKTHCSDTEIFLGVQIFRIFFTHITVDQCRLYLSKVMTKPAYSIC